MSPAPTERSTEGPRPRRSALDCLRRGALSTRANWGLVFLALLQNLLLLALLVASFLPFLVVLGGFGVLRGNFENPEAFEGWLEGLGRLAGQRLPALGLGLLASMVIGVAAVALWGWFQGGIMGTLVAAERQAHPRAQDRAGAWRWFKTLSGKDFAGWGGRYMWRYFWFFHLYVTCALLLLLVFVLLALGVGFGYESWGVGAAFGIGCGGALPLVFLLLVFALWYLAALPSVVVADGRVIGGASLGLQVIGRRLGGSLVLAAVLFVASLVLTLGLWVFQTAVNLLLQDRVVLWVTFYAVVMLFQWCVNSLLNVFGLASFTSLVVAADQEARG